MRSIALGRSMGCANRGGCLKQDRPLKLWTMEDGSNNAEDWFCSINYDTFSNWTCLTNIFCDARSGLPESRDYDPAFCDMRADATVDYVKEELETCVQAQNAPENTCFVEYQGQQHEDLRILSLYHDQVPDTPSIMMASEIFQIGEVTWIHEGEEGCPADVPVPVSTSPRMRTNLGTMIMAGLSASWLA